MLSRRHLRIKVLHGLYEFFQNEDNAITAGERKLMKSIQRIYELYLYELKILSDVLQIAEDQIEIKKEKRLPTKEDLNPNYKFAENAFLVWLSNNRKFLSEIDDKHVQWGDDRELLRKIFREFQKSEEYVAYMDNPERSLEEDKKIIKIFYGKYLIHNETLHQLYEEKDLHWADDLDAAQMMVSKTFKSFSQKSDASSDLQTLIKDSSDREFAIQLFRNTIIHSDKYGKMIHDKAQNWELERIAMLDIILMKMALAEMLSFKEIPLKVTLNEYIDLSKEYSTPKSGNFINGILDKLKLELSEKGDIKKIGRGLL